MLKDYIDSFNELLLKTVEKLDNRPTLHILDCNKIPVFLITQTMRSQQYQQTLMVIR